MMRVVFMGTPEFAVPALQALAKECEVVGVLSQPDAPSGRGLEVKVPPVKTKALELGLPVLQGLEEVAPLRPDVIVVAAFGKILREPILKLPRLGCVNIHSSLLPRWRGAAPIHWALLAGDAESGVTTMKIARELDAGDILLQARTPIRPDETAQSLHDRLSEMGGDLILPTLVGLESGRVQGIPQDLALVTHAPKLAKAMEWLDARRGAVDLDRQIRALSPWPGTSLFLSTGERLRILRAALRSDLSGREGSLYERSGMLLLGTRSGSLEILELQQEGKRPVKAGDFINGLSGKSGSGPSLPLEVRMPSA